MSDVEKVARAIPDEVFDAAMKAYKNSAGYPLVPANHSHAMRIALEAALAAMGEREAVAWEHFRDDSYFDLWCVRPTGERAFGVGFHVSTEAEAIALVETLAGKVSPRTEAVGEAVKAEGLGP